MEKKCLLGKEEDIFSLGHMIVKSAHPQDTVKKLQKVFAKGQFMIRQKQLSGKFSK